MFDTDKLAISFSGGRTSAVMTKILLDKFPEKEIIITFANTGLEHPDTLRFVKDCDENIFNNKVVWIEGVTTHGKRKGMGCKVVDFKTASRNGEPYREAVKKYGLFNKTNPSCTGRLKVEPMQKYLKGQGFLRGKKLNHWTAVGIRSDEIDRISRKRKELKFLYPLVTWGINKEDVLRECSKWSFDLRIDEHMGNCVGCFKKSIRKLCTVAKDEPKQFDFWRDIEDEFKELKTENNYDPKTGYRRIYRENRTVDDIFEISKQDEFRRFNSKDGLTQLTLFGDLDKTTGCGESCEVYADENW